MQIFFQDVYLFKFESEQDKHFVLRCLID